MQSPRRFRFCAVCLDIVRPVVKDDPVRGRINRATS
jgi:hypothetical protein